ncbi:hypothetical protein B4U79_14753, partial [Dinothrombium tinctorium]
MASSVTSSVESLNKNNDLKYNANTVIDDNRAVGESGDEKHEQSSSSCFSRPIFQLLLITSLTRLIIYLNKLYQDVNSVSEYYVREDVYFAIVSLIALILPPILYAAYLTGESLVKKLELDSIDLSTRTINGCLLIPWQIKRHLDVLYFAAQRVCFWRKPTGDEKQDMMQMERSAETLEFFEDFYAGFIQILLQFHIIFSSLSTPYSWGQIIGSALSILSLMFAVRRRDDGPLTSVLSFFGWISLITARVIAIALVSSFFKTWTLVLCTFHAVLVSIWIYKIAIASHEKETNEIIVKSRAISIESKRQRVTLWWLVFWFFGFPSLVYWPIMFQLKEHRRPEKFLTITFVENMFLLCLWLAVAPNKHEAMQIKLAIGVLAASVFGILCLLIYITCKPKYTDLLVLHEMKVENAHSYGIYYEFCDIVFRLPSSNKIAENLEI